MTLKDFEQVLYSDKKGIWHVDILIDGVKMRKFDFDTEQAGRSFFKLVSDIVHYFSTT